MIIPKPKRRPGSEQGRPSPPPPPPDERRVNEDVSTGRAPGRDTPNVIMQRLEDKVDTLSDSMNKQFMLLATMFDDFVKSQSDEVENLFERPEFKGNGTSVPIPSPPIVSPNEVPVALYSNGIDSVNDARLRAAEAEKETLLVQVECLKAELILVSNRKVDPDDEYGSAEVYEEVMGMAEKFRKKLAKEKEEPNYYSNAIEIMADEAVIMAMAAEREAPHNVTMASAGDIRRKERAERKKFAQQNSLHKSFYYSMSKKPKGPENDRS
jgi:hypothetical protein